MLIKLLKFIYFRHVFLPQIICMTKKQRIFLIISMVFLLAANFSYAAFPIRKHTPLIESSDKPATADNSEEEYAAPKGRGGHGHAHYGGGHVHYSHSGPSHHWQGVAHHYHARAYHYHTHYHHYHEHYSRGGYNGNGHSSSVLGGVSLFFDIFTPIALLLFGSLSAIGFSIGGVLFGGLGLIADKSKGLAGIGLIIGIMELAILGVLYSLMVI